jgi:hypothetical protein
MNTDHYYKALEEIARLIAQNSPSANGEEISDGECIDEVWVYLRDAHGIDPENYRADIRTITAPPEDGNRLFIGTCDTCNYLGTVYFTGGIGDNETVCLTCYNQTTAAQRQDVRNVLASSVIADAAPIDAMPTLTASASTPLGSAVSVCIGGDFGGWVVYCTDNSSEWVEGLFPDQDSAQRFADVYTQEGDNTATPLLIMTANREGWSH